MLFSITTEPPLSAGLIMISLFWLNSLIAFRSSWVMFCCFTSFVFSLDRVISFTLTNVSRTVEPKGAFQFDFSLNFLREFVSENALPVTLLSQVPLFCVLSFSFSKNCLVRNLLWKLSSSLRSFPAFILFTVGQNFRPLLIYSFCVGLEFGLRG